MQKCFLYFLSLLLIAPNCIAQNERAPKSLEPYAFGFNAQLMRGPAWSNRQFQYAVLSLKPQNLRYPGGTNSNYWDWKSGWVKQNISHNEWKNLPVIKNDLFDFAAITSLTKATPVFVLNMLTSNLNEQLAMLHSATDLGIPVKLIELGNEFYLSQDDYVKVFPTATAYVTMCNEWIKEIKTAFPETKIAVVGNSLRNVQLQGKDIDARGLEWNTIIYKNIKGADAVSFHLYSGSGLEQVKTQKQKVKHNKLAEYSTEEKSVWQEAFDKPEGLERTLCIPFVRTEMFNRNDATNVPAIFKIWITEYNMFENEGVVAGTWAHGLYTATETLLLLNHKSTSLLCFHNIVHTAQFGAIFNTNDAFKKNYKDTTNEKMGLSASGYALSLIGDAIRGMTTIEKIDLSTDATIVFTEQKKYPAVIGYKFSNEKSASYVLINLSEKPILLSSCSSAFSSGRIKSFFSNPRKLIGFKTDLEQTNKLIDVQSVLPAYSITLIR